MIKQDIQNKGYKYVWLETQHLNNTGFKKNFVTRAVYFCFIFADDK